MRLIEIKDLEQPKGTYFGVRPTKETIEAMQEFIKTHHIPNPVDSDDMHATVVYSNEFVSAKPLGKLDPVWTGTFNGYDIFGSSSDEDDEEKTGCLVIKFECDEITERHHDLRKNHGATHNFPDFKPHITLSYDVGDFDTDDLPDYDGTFEFDKEYSEPLQSDWSKK